MKFLIFVKLRKRSILHHLHIFVSIVQWIVKINIAYILLDVYPLVVPNIKVSIEVLTVPQRSLILASTISKCSSSYVLLFSHKQCIRLALKVSIKAGIIGHNTTYIYENILSILNAYDIIISYMGLYMPELLLPLVN